VVLETFINRIKSKLPLAVPPITLGRETRPDLDGCLDEVVQWTVKSVAQDYFVKPLEEFGQKWGKVFPEDPFYQDRMNYFLEYCVLERPLSGQIGTNLLQSYVKTIAPKTGFSEDSIWHVFGNYRHSVFEVTKCGDRQVVVRDLLSDARFVLRAKSGETLRYLSSKLVFQGFVFADGLVYRLGQGQIIHPPAARRKVIKCIKGLRKSNSLRDHAFLQQLGHLQMRYSRMQHVNAADLYGQYLPFAK
jgi:hypothetical protein